MAWNFFVSRSRGEEEWKTNKYAVPFIQENQLKMTIRRSKQVSNLKGLTVRSSLKLEGLRSFLLSTKATGKQERISTAQDFSNF